MSIQVSPEVLQVLHHLRALPGQGVRQVGRFEAREDQILPRSVQLLESMGLHEGPTVNMENHRKMVVS